MSRPLYVMKVSPTDLFVTRCKDCDRLNVHGFWGQLNREEDARRKRVVVLLPCRECPRVVRRVFRLTTSPVRHHRMTDWVRFGFRLMPYVPARWFHGFRKVIFWLERRVPL